MDAAEFVEDFMNTPKKLKKSLTPEEIHKILDQQYEEEYEALFKKPKSRKKPS